MNAFYAQLGYVEQHREDNHQMEADEYNERFPLPQYKQFLIANKGMSSFPETESDQT